ncbi:MAG TPA: HNH endonuclease signature motif containing protein [Actinophytocola sp.]|uniref:HNH endonuclease n=1 Tax=Actinophytocola sp. TaxID=1872138 RepID=UPI002DDD9C3A|nr:HNH endonuclease signature motif containing protein [Actinophytocola sp.]HEV2778942.1 HNH endonuclease signature motif containing protein [Actinophytocola sp.]
MTITSEARKRLWARSGNRCVICRKELVRDDIEGVPGALIGNEAHIIARSPGGPRYVLGEGARDDYENLILLCANDHIEVDRQPSRYTAEHLRLLKSNHEKWVSGRMRGRRWKRAAFVGAPSLALALVGYLVVFHGEQEARDRRGDAHSSLETASQSSTSGGDPVYTSVNKIYHSEGGFARIVPGGLDSKQRSELEHDLDDKIISSSLIEDMGVPVGADNEEIVVQAKTSTVLLTGLRVVVDEYLKPLSGSMLIVGSQGGGEPVSVWYDLGDRSGAGGQGIPARGGDGSDYFARNNYTLTPGEPVEFQVEVISTGCYCRYHFELDVSANGNRHTVDVFASNGKPFEVTSGTADLKDLYATPYPYGSEADLRSIENLGILGKYPIAEYCAKGTSNAFCNPDTPLPWEMNGGR